MGQATLMFGIGATKAGTSWLYRYLRSHPECRMPAVKELHYFNTTDAEAIQLQAANLNSKADKFLSQSEDHDGVRKLNTLMSSEEYRVASEVIKSDREGHSAYREFLLDSATEDGAKLAGDITPAYALLPEETLREMSDLTSETRFLYIMRDPVDRLWSNIRMNASRRLEEGRSLNEFSNTILERVVKRGQHPALMQRSDYASTLEKLDNAVPESNRKVLFFERLFFDSTIRDQVPALIAAAQDAGVSVLASIAGGTAESGALVAAQTVPSNVDAYVDGLVDLAQEIDPGMARMLEFCRYGADGAASRLFFLPLQDVIGDSTIVEPSKALIPESLLVPLWNWISDLDPEAAKAAKPAKKKRTKPKPAAPSVCQDCPFAPISGPKRYHDFNEQSGEVELYEKTLEECSECGRRRWDRRKVGPAKPADA